VIDLKKWECGIPGKENTMWAGGLFKLEVIFPDGIFAPVHHHLVARALTQKSRISYEAAKV
jgi:Ubiquitin-conjugating enzyme